MKVVAIYRAERFSPNSVDRDRAILDAVCSNVGECLKVREEDIRLHRDEIRQADVVLSMARGKEALKILSDDNLHAKVVNNATAIFHCSRSAIDSAMRKNKLPAAPLSNSGGGYWVKRGDEAAQQKEDVVYARNDSERDAAVARFMERGISDVVVTAHVAGDLVKFYGVAGTDFFHVTYPTEGNFSKFGDERINGKPCHTPFSVEALHRDATRLATIMGIDVYGGDCIVRENGTYAIIDFNDWPSFSTCRVEAAKAIAKIISERK